MEVQAIQGRGEPGHVIGDIADRVAGNASAWLAHNLDGIHAMVPGEISDVRRPHRRRRHVPVQEHERRPILRTARDDAGCTEAC